MIRRHQRRRRPHAHRSLWQTLQALRELEDPRSSDESTAHAIESADVSEEEQPVLHNGGLRTVIGYRLAVLHGSEPGISWHRRPRGGDYVRLLQQSLHRSSGKRASRRTIALTTVVSTVLWAAYAPEARAHVVGHASLVTWSCVRVACPHGTKTSNHAVAWPVSMSPFSRRLGYAASAGVYVKAARAMGMTVTVTRGHAKIYAGRVDEPSHRVVARLRGGQSRRILGLYADEVLSVQGPAKFQYRIRFALRPHPPLRRVVVRSTKAYWHCDTATCSGDPWLGEVVSWSPEAAHESNGRIGSYSRTVRAEDGRLLYPYMGPWADGCVVKAVRGTVLVIEWQRGADSWRETLLEAGETHTIDLVGSEDNAMIESPGTNSFTVALTNCTPKPLR